MSSYPFGKLQVLIVEAEDVNKKKVGEDLIYPSMAVFINYESKTFINLSTQVFYSSVHHPKWYEEFVVMVDDLSIPVVFELKDTSGPDSSKFSLWLKDVKPDERIEEWVSLKGPLGGEIKLVYTFTPMALLPGNFEKKSVKLSSFRLDITQGTIVDAGSSIEGSVIFMTPKIVTLKRIYLRLYGKESVSWTEVSLDLPINHKGETTLINKWYHGWENSEDEIDSGYYKWKFRVKVPEKLPPSTNSPPGIISYAIYAYLDHTINTDGVPIKVCQPVDGQGIKNEVTLTKHNIFVRCGLDKDVYYKEDQPIRVGINIALRNFSDYKVRKFKVFIEERGLYAAADGVYRNQKDLFKETYKENDVPKQSEWEGKFLTELPTNYKKLTLHPDLYTTRISIHQRVFVTIYKDTPLKDNKIRIELPLTITSKPINFGDEKKQLITLVKAMSVVTPPTPDAPRRSGLPVIYDGADEDLVELQVMTPVPDNFVDFNTPLTLTSESLENASMTKLNFPNITNPFIAKNPFLA